VFKIVKVQKVHKDELHCATHPDIYLMEKVLRKKGNEIYVK